MPSVLSRLASLFPSFRRTYAPAIPTPEERAAARIEAVKRDIDRSRGRPRPSTDEKIPTNYHGGAAGKVWFLPYLDSTTQDSPEIRAAMRLMRRSPWVKAAWEPQILTVASEDWQVQPSESGNSESEEQADFCKAVIEDCVAGAMIAVVRAICAPFGSEGHSLAEPVWGVSQRGKLAKKIVCTKFAAKDTDPYAGDVRLAGDEFGNVKWVEARRKHGQETYPIDDFVFSRYLTVFDEPLGEAAFRPSYASYWMLDTIDKLRMIHTEKKMAGMLVGTYTNDDDRGVTEDALRKAKTATWACLPEGVKFEALQISTASEPDYKSHQESKRDEIVTGIAFATLQIIQGNVPDARGDTKVQKAMADLGPWLLMTLVCDAVNRQFFPKLVDFNYPYPAGGAYPKLTFGAASNGELRELLQVVTGAQQAGFKLSKKHYGKALSLQEADPNDPDDVLETPGQGGAMGGGGFPPDDGMGGFGGGGFPPDDGMGGFGGGDPAGLPPFDPMGGGGVEGFSELVFEVFREPVKWTQIQGQKWKSAGGRVLSDASYQRHVGRIKKQGGRTAPATPSGSGPTAPASVTAPTQPGAPAPPVAPARRGRARRLAGALGRAGKAVAKAKYHAGKKTIGGIVYTGAQTARVVANGVDRLGAVLQRVPLLESWLGIGTTLRKSAARKIAQARQTAILAASGDRTAAVKRGATAGFRLLKEDFLKNKRRFGLTRALVIEAAYHGIKIAIGGVIGAGALAIVGTSGPVLAGLGIGAAIGYKTAKAVISTVVNPLIRQAVEYPFRAGKGKRGANHPARVLAAQMDKGGPTASPGSATTATRADRAKAGPGNLIPMDGSETSRSRRFAEEVATGPADPLDLVTRLREMLERDAGHEIDISDEDLAQLLADLLEYADELGEGVEEEVADSFAEQTADWDAGDWQHFAEWESGEWENFGWQAARTRTQGVKAVGTAEHSGQVLYGDRARAALARNAGASKRQEAPRTVRYDVTGADGSVRKVKEQNVSPARARAMAVASQLAANDVGGERPTQLKVTKQRAARKKAIADETGRLTEVGKKAQAGDPAAAKELQATGTKAVEAAAKAMAKLGPVPAAAKPMIRAAWLDSAKGMPKGERKEVQSLLSAMFEVPAEITKDAGWVLGKVGALAGWLGRQTARVARMVAGALGRFAVKLAKGAGYVGGALARGAWDRTKEGVEGAARGVWDTTKFLAGAAWRKTKPFLYWAAAMTTAAVLVGAPAVAMASGVIPLAAGFAGSIAGYGLVYIGGRKVGRYIASKFLVSQGQGAIVPKSLGGSFAEGVHAFAWSDWKQVDGKSWKSPGGRVLSDASYQRLSKGGGAPGKAESPTAAAPAKVAPQTSRVPKGDKTAPKLLPPSAPIPGKVYQISPDAIMVDPGRFQFKLNTDSVKGIGAELTGVQKWDAELGGVVAVWRDPVNGQTYVVNGHHRLELAKRGGAKDLSVRYLNAKTAEEARAKGALINIAEGRGTAVDAAKFMRDTGRSAEDLARAGVSLKGAVAKDAADLVKLAPDLFRQVAYGTLEPERAIAVARHLDDHLDQQRLVSALAKQEEKLGRAVSNRTVEAMAQEMRDSPKKTTTQESLFGPIEQDESVYFHRAELKSYLRAELAKEAKDFRLGSSVRRATALEAVSGNTLAVNENRKVADKADAALEEFDRGARLKGELSDILNDFATEYSSASNADRSQLRAKALAAVRTQLSGGNVLGTPRVEQRGPGLFD